MMHKVTVNSVNVTKPVRFGMAKSDHGEYKGARLWNSTRLARGSAPMAGWVPARAVLALLLQVAAERTGCVPTRVVMLLWGRS